MPVISLENVGIKFKKTKTSGPRPIGRSLASTLCPGYGFEEFWALQHVTFKVHKGDILGIVGNNGAGKSTLLKVLAGVLYPDEGQVTIDGKVSSLLSLGAGFMSDLSGKDNVYLNGIYLGSSKKELDRRYSQIVSFAELEDFIDTPVRYYSSGMKARLGFSIAVHVDPMILLIDEVLGAGDKNFRKKSEAKMHELMGRAKAIVIVSHNTKFIADFCNKGIWLEKGRIEYAGTASVAVDRYTDN